MQALALSEGVPSPHRLRDESERRRPREGLLARAAHWPTRAQRTWPQQARRAQAKPVRERSYRTTEMPGPVAVLPYYHRQMTRALSRREKRWRGGRPRAVGKDPRYAQTGRPGAFCLFVEQQRLIVLPAARRGDEARRLGGLVRSPVRRRRARGLRGLCRLGRAVALLG